MAGKKLVRELIKRESLGYHRDVFFSDNEDSFVFPQGVIPEVYPKVFVSEVEKHYGNIAAKVQPQE